MSSLIALFAAVAAWLVPLTVGLAIPYVPADDTVILERLPTKAADPGARELRELRARLAARPDDSETAVRLARRYFRLAMAEGDPRFIGYAEAALGRWWTEPAPPADLLVARALVKQYRHEFDAALADLAQAGAIDPTNTEVWSWRAALHLVRAEYAAAAKDCEAMRATGSEYDWIACKANLDGMTGNASRAYAALHAAFERAGRQSPSGGVWPLTRLAEFALRLGENARAEQHFRAALALGHDDQYLLAAYADFLLDEGRPAEVVANLSEWIRSDGLLLRLALAEQKLGAPKLAEHVQALSARFDAAARRGDRLHQQEEARFRLHLRNEPKRALALAQENWKVQREPRDARVLLEAALATGDREAARPVLDWLVRSRHEDPVLRRLAAQLGEASR
jgi:tetratricopeptide (TPR) repeat protein